MGKELEWLAMLAFHSQRGYRGFKETILCKYYDFDKVHDSISILSESKTSPI